MTTRGAFDQSPLDSDEGMQWLRLYNDVLDDPKVQRLSPDLFKLWINLLCLANEGKERGRIPYTVADIAFRLRLGMNETAEAIEELKHAGLLEEEGDCLVPHGWDERQFQSDDVNARVKAHRERNVTRNVTEENPETLHVTPPEQIQTQKQSRTDQTLAPSRGRYSDEFEHFWTKYPKVLNSSKKNAAQVWERMKPEKRAAAMAGLDKYLASEGWQRGFAPHTTTYLRGELWDSDPPPARMNGHTAPVKPEERRPAIPPIEQVLQPAKQLSDEKRAELAAMFAERRQR